MIREEFTFNLYDTKFYGKYFQPKNVKTIIVLVHGMGEHSKRYERFVIPFFNKNSVGVIAFDQFGHGLTEGIRGHNPGFEAILDCVDLVIMKALDVFGDKPVFLYGHSMGGNVVINYALRRENNLKGIIVTSPFLRLAFSPPGWKIFLGKILQKIMPSITMGNELDVEAISRDKNEIELYKNDPLVHDKVSPNYSIVFMETGEWAIQNASKINIPMLLMHGTGDRLTSWKASKEFKDKANDNVELHLFKDAYHELHNELNKDEVVEKMITWMNKILIKTD